MFINKAKATNMVEAKKFRHFVHSAFSLEESNLKVECDEQGRMRLIEAKSNNEIDCSASIVNTISKLISIASHQGIRIEISKDGNVVLTQEVEAHNSVDKKFDKITVPVFLINRVSRMLMATRRVVLKDEPFKYEDEPDE
jgi:hypothetical protein